MGFSCFELFWGFYCKMLSWVRNSLYPTDRKGSMNQSGQHSQDCGRTFTQGWLSGIVRWVKKKKTRAHSHGQLRTLSIRIWTHAYDRFKSMFTFPQWLKTKRVAWFYHLAELGLDKWLKLLIFQLLTTFQSHIPHESKFKPLEFWSQITRHSHAV